MKCNEVQTMQGPYLDSELDAKTTFEIEQHLATCPPCARVFAQEQNLEARITTSLNQGSRTAGLWAQIERKVAAASSASRPRPPALVPQQVGWPVVLSALGTQIRAGWRTSRWAWTGLAAVWAVILLLNLAEREPEGPLAAGRSVPSVSEMRLALKQKSLLMAELPLTPEPALPNKPSIVRPSPHSEWRNETRNA
jgi:anti-sigma factor RsiW